MFDHVWAYVVVGSAAVGILLSQSAFKAARSTARCRRSPPLEPIVGIGPGLGLLGDTVSVSVGGLAASSSCLLAMVVGVAHDRSVAESAAKSCAIPPDHVAVAEPRRAASG